MSFFSFFIEVAYEPSLHNRIEAYAREADYSIILFYPNSSSSYKLGGLEKSFLR